MRYILTVLRKILLISGIAFALHYLWEVSHVALYGGYEHLSPYLPITVLATFGDVAYTLGAYFFVALIKRDWHWLARMTKLDLVAIAFIGFTISMYVEYKALALERWFYLPAMPIIPGLQVGLSPIAQMTILLPLTFFLTDRLYTAAQLRNIFRV